MTSKLALVIVILLLLLSLSGITAAAITVNAARDRVEVTATTIAGDPAVLDGLSLRLCNTYNHYLFWDTAYTPLDDTAPLTTFDISSIRRGEPAQPIYDGVQLHNGLSFGYSMSGSGYQEEDFSGEERGLIAAYNQLYRETPDGEERSMVIDLSDYYDYYPVTGSIRLPNYSRWIDWEDAHLTYTPTKESALYTAHRLNEYFKIPMLPDQLIEISIRKSHDGRTVGVGSSSLRGMYGVEVEVDEYYLNTFNAVADDACYFTVSAHTARGIQVDVSRIEGGYGIYRLPCGGESVDIDALQNVYPLDPADGAILKLTLSPDQRKLLLYRENGLAVTLTVIDRAAMQTLQTISLGSYPAADEAYWSFHDGGDYHVISLGYARLLVIDTDETGAYGIRLDVLVDELSLGTFNEKANHFRYLYPTMTSAWDGERLAMADSMAQHGGGYDKYSQACDFYLAVFTADGLQYYGIHETSLNADNDPRNTNAACWPMDHDPLTLSWRNAD